MTMTSFEVDAITAYDFSNNIKRLKARITNKLVIIIFI